MRIGIITWFTGPNYGTNLQAIALQYYLRKQGYEVELINCEVESEYSKNRRTFIEKIEFFPEKCAQKLACRVFFKKEKAIRDEKLVKTIRKNCILTRRCEAEKDLVEVFNSFDLLISGSDQIWNPNWYHRFYYADYEGVMTRRISYAPSMGVTKILDEVEPEIKRSVSKFEAVSNEADVFITGSDQVWNYLIVDRDGTYYLDFVKNRRTCSYAASFGVASIPQEYREFYRKNLNNIDSISVREGSGAEIVKNVTGREAKVMPDPTLLVNQETWNRLCATPNDTGKYILVYKITKADKLLSFSKKLSKKTGLPIVYIPNDLKSGSIGKLKTNVGPEEWLGYIKNAEYVVTNSFHGTVFSILFNKKFFSEVSSKVNPSTSRLKSLLEMFGLEERTLECYTDKMLDKELDKAEINKVLEAQRERAYDFFKQVF